MRPSTTAERTSEVVERGAPPRIPVTDQRLIRITAAAALAGVLLSALLLTSINPSVDPIAGLAASFTFGCTLALAIAPILLVESYRRHPGQWRGRRRRALRRSFIVGAIAGGYSAFRVVGLGSPSGLLIALLIAAVIEAALTRADDDSV
jgi:hypothetical protein